MPRFQMGRGPYGSGYDIDPNPVTEDDEFVRRTPQALTFAPGHLSRRMSCLMCGKAIGGQPFTPVEAATCNPCPCGTEHFTVYSVPVHVTCANVSDDDILRAFEARIMLEGNH